MLRAALASERRVAWAACALAAAWLVAMLAAPLLVPPGTVTALDGRENHVDHLTLWLDLPLVPAVVYGIGDVLCHQKDWRSMHLNGNALPVDERMTAIFAAGALGLAWGAAAGAPGLYLSDAARPLLPGRLRAWLPTDRAAAARRLLLVVTLALTPAAVDVLWENLWGRESTRALRLVTGTVAGVAGGAVLACACLGVDAFARLVWANGVGPRVRARWPRAAARLDPYLTPRPSASRP